METKMCPSQWLRMVITLLPFLLTFSGAEKLMFCYFGSDAQYRPSPGKFLPTNIDASLCTHVIFAFVAVTDNSFQPQNWNDLGSTGLYAQSIALKAIKPSLKVLLAVGGWVAGYDPFQNAVGSEVNMTKFAESAVAYLRAAGLDGLDMDWEFPASRGSPPEDKKRFTKLLETINAVFQKEAQEKKRDKLLLTMAAAVGTHYISTAYESTEIHRHVDYMLLMTYNFHGGWDNQTGHHSTILPSKYDTGIKQRLCQTWAVNYWLSVGVPKSKMILGLATYGMSFTLDDPNIHGLNASSHGGGKGGRFTRQDGILAYYEICENIQKKSWTREWVEELGVPYAYSENQWVGYDDVTSIKMKAETLIMGMNLAGAFIWSVDLDDFGGHCGTGRYPLLRAINDAIRPCNRQASENSGKIPKDEVPLPKPESPSDLCQTLGAGTYTDVANCRWYFSCNRNSSGFTRNTERCPPGLSFDGNLGECALSSFCA